jgi:hypothetical protein
VTRGGLLGPGSRPIPDRVHRTARAAAPWAVVVAAVVAGAWGRADAQRQPGWEVRVAERVELATGASGTISVGIAVDRGLTVSRDAHVIVELSPSPGLKFKRRRLGRGDAVDPGADAPRFTIPVRADQPGEHAVRVRVRFWLCGGKVCRPIDVRRTAIVAVTSPAPPDAGVDAPAADAPPAAGKRR